MINFEYWQLLLIPLLFALGWGAARIDIRHLVKESRALPRSYFQGLNFLLNEEPDRAVESFMEAVKLDPQTIELHFALGSLFRRRGEFERAIRMHKNLLNREGLPQDFRLEALAELGEDYLKAGLLDRAEEMFTRLKDSERKNAAERKLLEIFELEKSWEKAILIANHLPDADKQVDIAQYYCELAASELMRSQFDTAQKHLQTAFETNRKCVRASLLQGDLFLQQNELEKAIKAWQFVEQQNPDYLSLVAPRLVDAYQKLQNEETSSSLLRGYLEAYPSLDLLDVVFARVLEKDGAEASYALVRKELQKNATLLGLDKLIAARLLFAPAEVRADLELARHIVKNYTQRLARYRCKECGFLAKQFYWRCPACGDWETYSPKRTEEFEKLL